MDIYQFIGIIGMLCVVVAYSLSQLEKLHHDSWLYLWLNLLGAIFLIISLLVHFNLGSFIIEVFWIFITIFGMYKTYKKGKL